jgi:S-adenosylmethionine decarboxylase
MITKTKRLIQWVVDKKNKISYAGIHLVADFWGGQIIEDPKEIEEILIMAAKKGGCIPLKVTTYKFSPQGITGVVLLAESHIAIHSWPEHNYVAVDIFTCGDKSLPYKAFEYLKEKFQPTKIKLKKVKRGRAK